MEFYLCSAEKLKVTLTARDLRELGITYEDMDYSDPLTRKALIALLEQGRSEVGFNPRRAKLFIEVYPSEDGGCVLYFTCLHAGDSHARSRVKPGPTPVVFEFDDVDILIDACCKLSDQYGHRIYQSRLYGFGEDFRLIVYPLDYADGRSVGFLSEYARLVGEGEVLAAFTEEHGRPLIEDEAVDLIAQKLGDKNNDEGDR